MLLALAGCKKDLYTSLQEREANEMLALLLNHGIDAERALAKDGTNTIRVEEQRLAVAIDLLEAEGLPRQTFKNLGEVFKGSGLIASPTEERARFIYAMSEELSRTISDIDGVLSARIHVVLPKNDLLKQDTTPSSASVFVRHDVRTELNSYLPQIKMLVANSIEGLSYDKVAVVFIPVQRNTPAISEMAASPVGSRSAAQAGMSVPVFIAVSLGLLAFGGVLGGVGFSMFRNWRKDRRKPVSLAEPVACRKAMPPPEGEVRSWS